MNEQTTNITNISVEQELTKSFMDYAMSVIVSRSLPDVRDGLKPVHRRILYAMYKKKNDWNKPYMKSAAVLGDVLGKYHPHGDSSVYDAIVRMAQDFSMRYMLIDGQGNFGSVDGDSAAAYRYTEIRMSRLAHCMLLDLEKDTVDFADNYNNTEKEPTVLPTRFPNLLITGSSGIAVGMATNIPPHNLKEIMTACVAVIDNPEITIDELLMHVSGPDFPTAGIINGKSGIIEAYKTGRGKIYIRAKAGIEDVNNKPAIVITELPYMVNKAKLLEKVAELVKEKRIEGVTAIRDESDRTGMRAVIEVRRGENADVLLNKLYTMTQMQSVFGINMVALEGNRPKTLNLKQILAAFIEHRREVVRRRTIFELNKARNRVHILQGLAVALANIDEMINIIKQAKTPNEAKDALVASDWSLKDFKMPEVDPKICQPADLSDKYGWHDSIYRLSPKQAQAILDLKLHRLTGLEREKIVNEFNEVIAQIIELLTIINDYSKLMSVIKTELEEIREQYEDPRKTEIIVSKQDYEDEDLIPNQDVVVTISNDGYIKSQLVDTYQAQRRGGKGKSAGAVKTDDQISDIYVMRTHDHMLCFSNRGKVYWLRVFELPMMGRQSKGRPIVNFLPLNDDEEINAILPVKEFSENEYIIMATQRGTIKKIALSAFSRPRSNGVIALDLFGDDQLIGVDIIQQGGDIFLFSDAGKVIRFHESQLRVLGRTARGVRGMKLASDQKLISLIVQSEEGYILTVTNKGFGKRTAISDYRVTARSGQGIKAMQLDDRNGKVVCAKLVKDDHDIMLITNKSTLVRIPVNQISVIGRSTRGVKLINLTKDELLIGVQTLDESQVEDEGLDDVADEAEKLNQD